MSEQNNTEWLSRSKHFHTKDAFEAPNAPHVFQKDWQPEVKLEFLIRHLPQLADDVYEVVLRVTVTVSGEETAFLCGSAGRYFLHQRY